MKLKLSFLFVISFVTNNLSAQINCLEMISTEIIISITDDEEFIWCGTEASGLLRINKETEEKLYWNTDNSILTSNRIKSVINYNNQLYFSSDSVLMVLDDMEVTILNDSIEGRMMVNEGGELVISGRRDFYIINSDGSIIYHQDLMEVVNDQCCSQISDMDIDADGNVWLSHYDFYEYDVLKYDGISWQVYNHNNTDFHIESWFPNPITTVNNQVIASSWGGMYQFDNDEWELIHNSINSSIQNEEENIDGYGIRTLEAGAGENLWVGANNYLNGAGGKICFRSNGAWLFVKNGIETFPFISVFHASVVDDDIMYVGTEEGLIIIDKSCLFSLTATDDLTTAIDFSIHPVPAINKLTIESDVLIKKIIAYDTNGNLLMEQYGAKTIDISNLPAGKYFLEIQTEVGSGVRSFVKK